MIFLNTDDQTKSSESEGLQTSDQTKSSESEGLQTIDQTKSSESEGLITEREQTDQTLSSDKPPDQSTSGDI